MTAHNLEKTSLDKKEGRDSDKSAMFRRAAVTCEGGQEVKVIKGISVAQNE